MTGRPDEGWKIFADGDEADNVPLWKVLAQFRSDDLDEGLSANAAIINQAKPSPVRFYNLAFGVSFGFGFLSVIFLIGLLISDHSKATDLFFYLTLAMLAATMAPHLWRQLYQYGLKIPEVPLKLPHPPDRLFDEVLEYLQRADGPRAYYLSRFRKKRIPLKRRQFFGRLDAGRLPRSVLSNCCMKSNTTNDGDGMKLLSGFVLLPVGCSVTPLPRHGQSETLRNCFWARSSSQGSSTLRRSPTPLGLVGCSGLLRTTRAIRQSCTRSN